MSDAFVVSRIGEGSKVRKELDGVTRLPFIDKGSEHERSWTIYCGFGLFDLCASWLHWAL